MLNFNAIVDCILTEAPVPNIGQGINSSKGNPYTPTNTTVTATSSLSGFNPDASFKDQIITLIFNKLYPPAINDSESVFKQQFIENSIRLVSSGYGSISDAELKQNEKYWPVIDVGYAILEEIGINASGKEAFKRLKNGTIRDAITDNNRVIEITNLINYVSNIKGASNYKEWQNYRLRTLSGGSGGRVNALIKAADAWGAAFGQYFKPL
jgi:hypothetical protein